MMLTRDMLFFFSNEKLECKFSFHLITFVFSLYILPPHEMISIMKKKDKTYEILFEVRKNPLNFAAVRDLSVFKEIVRGN